ncbi:MAG TPA: alpha-ketoacid dehydrogenase subunit beta [Candidatus Desulfofervidus auxilii]|uniref:Alpha-ketoacid dehydrogenase subunit beta n=1 Tax=Desulfofervidus auxilii TaxID=1621989 RepID=A0A7C0Y3D2_DESA2|nr:alpha-ketoacid dehydrogenase subunit beta [Candidatus Desulfofervidus auxilii]
MEDWQINVRNWGTAPDLPDILPKKGERILTYGEAIYEATKISMNRYSDLYILGEGANDKGGIYGTTKDLYKIFGENRVFDMPIAEELITGIGLGIAIGGKRAIVIHPRQDFVLVCMNQLINHVFKWKFSLGLNKPIKFLLRTIASRGWGSGAQHAQDIHSVIAHFPGAYVLVPFTPYDVKGFILWALEEAEEPVVILEHRWLYKVKGYVKEGFYTCIPDRAQIIKEGNDITLIGISYGVFDALLTSIELEKYGISAEIIDLRSLRPCNLEAIFSSLEKTKRLVVIDTGHLFISIASEIFAQVLEEGINLISKPLRYGLPDMPTPAFDERKYYPNYKEIAKDIIKCVC